MSPGIRNQWFFGQGLSEARSSNVSNSKASDYLIRMILFGNNST